MQLSSKAESSRLIEIDDNDEDNELERRHDEGDANSQQTFEHELISHRKHGKHRYISNTN